MNRRWRLGLVTLVFAGSAQAQAPSGRAQTTGTLAVLPRAKVTVLVDNMAGPPPLLGEWGLAFLIETDQHQVLFDAGGGQALRGNARALGVDLCKAEAIVISHEHDDHTVGLPGVLDACEPVDLFVHPAGFDTRYWKEDSGAVAHRLPFTREQLRDRVRSLVETTGPTAIREGLMVTGQIPRVTDFEDTGVREYAFLDERMTTPDPILDDQAMYFRVPEGVVILLGCGHAGLVNTMAYVSALTGDPRIYAVLGGTHLLGASPLRMRQTVEALRRYDVQQVMLSHCTGVRAYAELANALPDRCSWPASGTVITFGGQ